MGLGCGSSLIKIILFVFNLLCVLGGIFFIAIGGIMISKAGDVEAIVKETNAYALPIGLIVIGSIIFIIAFFGCCGAVRESHCMTMTYAFLLFVVIVLQIVLAALVFLYRDDFNKAVTDATRQAFERQNENMEALDVIQRKLECCGAEGPKWWQVVSLPPSCCPPEIKAPQCTMVESYQRGCIAALRETIRDYGNYVAYGVLIVAGVELLGLIFACCLSTSIRNEQRRSAF